jgi:hypothetical protein
MMNNIKPIIIAALVMMALILSVAVLGQTAMAETSAGYSAKLNTATFIMKVGFMSDDAEVNNAHGIYAKMNYNLTRRSNVPQIIGIHYLYNLNGVRVNIGGDYHIGSNDIINNPQTGWRLSYGVSKYFQHSPVVISADVSGRYFTASIGLFATL